MAIQLQTLGSMAFSASEQLIIFNLSAYVCEPALYLNKKAETLQTYVGSTERLRVFP